MNKTIIVFLICAVLILGVIIVVIEYFAPTTVTEKPKPNLTVDISPFIEAGCVKEKYYSSYYYLNCSSIKLEEKYSCDRIWPTKHLGGLTPRVPIVECTFWKKNWTADEGILDKGCAAPIYNKYIVLSDGEFKLINNREEFKQFFAPVETPEEALSFAVALTGSYPVYDIEIPSHYVVYVPEIEETYVKETSDGFVVHLFHHTICGCGPHPVYAVDYLVTRTGEVKEISRQKIYEDPTDRICAD